MTIDKPGIYELPTSKLCECGCGDIAPVAKRTSSQAGYIKGQPKRFIFGHQNRRENNSKWNDGRSLRQGYQFVQVSGHPRAGKDGYVREHIIVAEKALGHSLPKGTEVHHVNEHRSDNRNVNLVICEDSAFHKLLHQRKRAYATCGNASWRKCKYCKAYDDQSNMNGAMHRLCYNEYMRTSRHAKC